MKITPTVVTLNVDKMADEMKDGDEGDVVAPEGPVVVEPAVLEALVNNCIAEYGGDGLPEEQRAVLLDLFGSCPLGHNGAVCFPSK
jgi:hypothetical protein